jgi:hypothetical protein
MKRIVQDYLNRFKPSVDKKILLFLSFFVWVAVGVMLLNYARSWLEVPRILHPFVFAGIGICAALVIHHFGFLKLVDKNLGRIMPMEGKKCLFSFMTWKSYFIVVIMVTMGILLRHSAVPKSYLSVIYIGIGLSLILSSIRYLRFFLRQLRPAK